MKKTIVIVEDDPDQRENYRDAITKKGYLVRAYGSRAEALAGFEQALPDLAILDIILGDEIDAGFELSTRSRDCASALGITCPSPFPSTIWRSGSRPYCASDPSATAALQRQAPAPSASATSCSTRMPYWCPGRARASTCRGRSFACLRNLFAPLG
ncbi:MAG: response regulator transcription factor, partial [Pseudomonadales bacterium]